MLSDIVQLQQEADKHEAELADLRKHISAGPVQQAQPVRPTSPSNLQYQRGQTTVNGPGPAVATSAVVDPNSYNRRVQPLPMAPPVQPLPTHTRRSSYHPLGVARPVQPVHPDQALPSIENPRATPRPLDRRPDRFVDPHLPLTVEKGQILDFDRETWYDIKPNAPEPPKFYGDPAEYDDWKTKCVSKYTSDYGYFLNKPNRKHHVATYFFNCLAGSAAEQVAYMHPMKEGHDLNAIPEDFDALMAVLDDLFQDRERALKATQEYENLKMGFKDGKPISETFD